MVITVFRIAYYDWTSSAKENSAIRTPPSPGLNIIIADNEMHENN